MSNLQIVIPYNNMCKEHTNKESICWAARNKYKTEYSIYLHLQSFSQTLDGELGRRVGSETKESHLSRLGRQKDDPAHPALLHGGDHSSAGVHAAQVVNAHQFLQGAKRPWGMRKVKDTDCTPGNSICPPDCSSSMEPNWLGTQWIWWMNEWLNDPVEPWCSGSTIWSLFQPGLAFSPRPQLRLCWKWVKTSFLLAGNIFWKTVLGVSFQICRAR